MDKIEKNGMILNNDLIVVWKIKKKGMERKITLFGSWMEKNHLITLLLCYFSNRGIDI